MFRPTETILREGNDIQEYIFNVKYRRGPLQRTLHYETQEHGT